jgi:hypothetical protein
MKERKLWRSIVCFLSDYNLYDISQMKEGSEECKSSVFSFVLMRTLLKGRFLKKGFALEAWITTN